MVTSVPQNPKTKWIRVPDDPALANSHCPICQEKFETQWNTDAQDFVWMDAAKIGARVYHASCHAEASKDGGGTPMRAITPDPVLGKRKADVRQLHSLLVRPLTHNCRMIFMRFELESRGSPLLHDHALSGIPFVPSSHLQPIVDILHPSA